MLRDGWLKDQMKKATEEVKDWPDWMVKLDEVEAKMEKTFCKSTNPYLAVDSASNQAIAVDPN
jgi:citrate synthase